MGLPWLKWVFNFFTRSFLFYRNPCEDASYMLNWKSRGLYTNLLLQRSDRCYQVDVLFWSWVLCEDNLGSLGGERLSPWFRHKLCRVVYIFVEKSFCCNYWISNIFLRTLYAELEIIFRGKYLSFGIESVKKDEKTCFLISSFSPEHHKSSPTPFGWGLWKIYTPSLCSAQAEV